MELELLDDGGAGLVVSWNDELEILDNDEDGDKVAQVKEERTVHEFNPAVLLDSLRIVAEVFGSDEAGDAVVWGATLDFKLHILVDCFSVIVETLDSFAV